MYFRSVLPGELQFKINYLKKKLNCGSSRTRLEDVLKVIG
jgi:hypothetical protein